MAAATKDGDLDGVRRRVGVAGRVADLPGGKNVVDSEALIALNALCDLGVVKRRGERYDLDKQRWNETEQLREGIKSAIAILADESHSARAHLCVSLPPTLAPAAEHVIRESSTDLRSGMLDVIVGAQESLLIASPFWDAGTSEEIAKLAKKRLGGGVSVTILGRFSRDLPVPVRAELRKCGVALFSHTELPGSELSHSLVNMARWLTGVPPCREICVEPDNGTPASLPPAVLAF